MKHHRPLERGPDATLSQVFTTEDIPVLTLQASVPQFVPQDRRSRRINRYYRQFLRSTQKYCQNGLLPSMTARFTQALAENAPLPEYRVELHYHISYENGRFWSLYLESAERENGHTRLRIRRGDCWDLETGYPIALSAFFPVRHPWRSLLLAHTVRQMQAAEEDGTSLYHPDWRERVRRQFNPMNFYLTLEGLCWFYPMYALGPSAEGIPRFCLPWGEDFPTLPPAHRL